MTNKAKAQFSARRARDAMIVLSSGSRLEIFDDGGIAVVISDPELAQILRDILDEYEGFIYQRERANDQ